MDKLMRYRVRILAAVTRTSSLIEEELVNGRDLMKLGKLLYVLEDKAESLQELDTKILDLLNDKESSSDDFERECVEIDARRDKFLELKYEVNTVLSVLLPPPASQLQGQPGTAAPVQTVMRRFKLPPIQLNKFGGNLKEWLSFWGQFKKVHEDVSMPAEDKFYYLLDAMTDNSRPRDLVNSFPGTAENYPKAVDALVSRFGRDDVIIEYYVRDLLRLVLTNNSKRDLTHLYDQLEAHLRALESLKVTGDKYAAILYPLVESCLPEDTLRAWVRYQATSNAYTGNNPDDDTLKKIMRFLKSEVEGEERIRLAKASLVTRLVAQEIPSGSNVPTASGFVNSAREYIHNANCIFCDKRHNSSECVNVQSLSLEERKKCLMRARACYNCLKRGHISRYCKASKLCSICNHKHDTLLCAEKGNVQYDSKEKIATLNNVLASADVVLQTLIVRIRQYGKTRLVRALLDTGSQKSYLLSEVAQKMALKIEGNVLLQHRLFGGTETGVQDHNIYEIELLSCDDLRPSDSRIRVLSQPSICGRVAAVPNGPWLAELAARNIQLSDVGTSDKIELLLGADVIGLLLTGVRHVLSSGLVAIETYIGWTLMGSITHQCTAGFQNDSVTNAIISLFVNEPQISDLWNLDVIGIRDEAYNREKEDLQEAANSLFKDKIKINDEGRYEVCLSWIRDHPILPNNKIVAKKRFYSTERKLSRDGLLADYKKVFEEWLAEGIVEEVPLSEIESPGHYLPHRAVVKESSSTTKIRPVFDASCKERPGVPSMNECLASGTNLMALITVMLIKFREKQYGVISDIRKAFLQVAINANDRDFLRFFSWAKDGTIKEYRHRRVVFGLTCSPFLLAATIKHHLESAPLNLQETAMHLLHSFYVDNCVTSLNSKPELDKFVLESTILMATAKMDLRGWEYSYDHVGVDEASIDKSFVLGLQWCKLNDNLSLDIKEFPETRDQPLTKRLVLTVANRIFDPIGFASPVTVFPKMLLQEIWGLKVGWDEKLPDSICVKYEKWSSELALLKEVVIARWFNPNNAPVEGWSLHVFSDASQHAYAACVFMRCEIDLNVTVQLIQARVRIAPLNKLSIPRLELLGCLIGARLSNEVKNVLGLQQIPTFHWTDSVNALCWIRREDQWGVYVWNRVAEIRKLTMGCQWKHVSGTNNPADLPSRGCSVRKLISTRWWEGPQWLYQPKDVWPSSQWESHVDEEEVQKERKKVVIVGVSAVSAPFSSKLLARFSRYNSIVRTMAWMRRFIHNCRNPRDKIEGSVAVEEYVEAERKIVYLVQTESFQLADIKKIKTLNIVRDHQEILRVKTRIILRDDHEDFKYPMLLPNSHRFVELLVLKVHLEMSHAGVSIVLASLRELFWILRGRKTISNILSRCVVCRRFNQKRLDTIEAPLPKNRINDARAFEVVGVDLAGPLILKTSEKGWIVLYTCAVYRAVHLEFVLSLSTEAFLKTFRRFIARRGRPRVVYSDNGTNFVGAYNMFKTIDWEEIQTSVTVQNIEWKFNPPTAAWWGGWWERLIRMVKELLRRVLGRASLEYEEITTILCDCEAAINARPLTYITEDGRDTVALTPAKFLQEQDSTVFPEVDQLDRNSFEMRVHYCQRLRDNLRERFRREYLGLLREKTRTSSSGHVISVDDVVLIGDNLTKRLDWPLARVVAVYPGQDGECRVARLKTATGELIRPIQRLYPLEI